MVVEVFWEVCLGVKYEEQNHPDKVFGNRICYGWW